MSSYRLRDDLLGIVIMAAIFALIAGAILYRSSPVKSVVGLEATIEGVRLETSHVGTSSSYSYTLRLENCVVVIVSDYLYRPHLQGTRVKIEQVTHQNGYISHRFPAYDGSLVSGFS
jgi:hypothetical protein